jgi:general stress protein 26
MQKAPPAAIDVSKFAEAVNCALEEGTPCVLVSADKNGYPDVAFKGSTMVFDDQHLAWWERSRAEQIEQVEENPHVAILYRSAKRGMLLRFYGDAAIHRDDSLREEVMKRVIAVELEKDPERKGFAVLVEVNRVRLSGNTIQQRPGTEN